MEKRLFNIYLEYMKTQNVSVWKRLSKLPNKIKAQLICTFIALVGSFTLSVIGGNMSQAEQQHDRTIITIIYMCLLVYIVVQTLFTYRSIDKYEINTSKQNMIEYWNYCQSNRIWFIGEMALSENSNITVDQNILLIKERIDNYIKTLEDALEKRSARIERIVQVLAIPFVLAIITSIVDKQENIMEAMAIVVSIILIMTMMFGFIWLFNNIMGVIRKQKVEQLKVFSADLQGMWDYMNIYNRCT